MGNVLKFQYYLSEVSLEWKYLLISKPTNDSKTYSWNASAMKMHETSISMHTLFDNLFLNLESIGNKGE